MKKFGRLSSKQIKQNEEETGKTEKMIKEIEVVVK